MKILADYNEVSKEDAKKLKTFLYKEYPDMETSVEIIELPSGKTAWVYCDGRVFLEEKESK